MMKTNTSTALPSDAAPNPGKALFRDRNFNWMIGGGIVSMLGDQFTLIALPWLVLQMSSDTRVLGTVVALLGIPRALFILIGGALVDRYSPKRVMLLSKYANAVLLSVLTWLVMTGSVTLPWLYGLSLAIGLATAFSIPSGSAIIPQVVAGEQLQAANGLMLGLRQLAMFIGPLLAGLLIALFGSSERAGTVSDARGLALAFGFDAFSFVLSAWTLSKVQLRVNAAPVPHQGSVLASVMEGLRSFWADVHLRTCLLYWAAVAVLISGPVHIALPVLAQQMSGLGAAALGTMLAAHGAGTLLGMAVAGAKPKLRLRTLGLTLLTIDAVVALLFMPLGYITASWQGAGLLLLIGLMGGFMQVAVFTWIQRRVPPHMLGRAMSLFMFIFMGLAPLSSAATGWLMRSISVSQLFFACGAALLACVAVALLSTRMGEVRDAT